jgi:Uncharacterized protein conserved in bacteria (DUF2330)
VRYETEKFMLPLRLSTVNANGPQDLIFYALTQSGRGPGPSWLGTSFARGTLIDAAAGV